MKRIITGLLVIFLIALGCGKVKDYPTSATELSYGGADCVDFVSADPSNYTGCFSFEDDTTIPLAKGFISDKADSPAYDISFDTTLENSTVRAYKGTHSLRMKCTYVDSVGNSLASGIIKQGSSIAPLNVNFEHKKITAYVWIPGNMFASTPNNSYGANFFYATMAADGWRWYQSEWVNLSGASNGVAGVWTKLSAYTDQMTTTNPATSGGHTTGVNPPTTYTIKAWGIKIAKGDGTADYSTDVSNPDTYVYIDAVTVEPQ